MPLTNSKTLKPSNSTPKKWIECCTCHEIITAENFHTHKHISYIDKSDCPRAKGKPMKND